MKSPIDILLGFCRVTIGAEYAEKALNAMLKKELPHRFAHRDENGDLTFEIRRKYRDLLFEIIDKCGISVYSVYEEGLPCFVLRYRRRWGIVVGCVIFALCMVISRFFIWDVNVVSADGLDGAVIEQQLETLGLKTGSFRPSIDFYELCNSYLASYKDCAWISVNVIGNVAYVEALSRKVPPEKEDSEPRDLVAACDGMIVSREVFEGSAEAGTGDAVKAGDILVSGRVEDKQGDVYFRHSRGRVLADIQKTFSAAVPYSEEKEVPAANEAVSRSLVIFGNEIPLSFGGDYNGETREDLSQFSVGGKDLPFAILTKRAVKTEKTIISRSPETAEIIAEYRVSNECAKVLGEAHILSINKNTEQSENECTVTWTVRCIADIAVPSPLHEKMKDEE